MRIALLIYGSIDQVSGGYFYDRKLVEHLRMHGDVVSVFSLPRRWYFRSLLQNFRTFPAATAEPGGPGSPHDPRDFDVIIQDELLHPSLFLANLRQKNTKPVIVSLVHHLRSSENHPRTLLFVYRIIEKIYLNSVDGFIFNSRSTRKDVVRLLKSDKPGIVATPSGKFPHVPGAGNTRNSGEPPRTQRPLSLLFVGNLISRKGLHVLLDALSALNTSNIPDTGTGLWRLVVAGDPDADRRYARRIKKRAQTFPAGQVVFEGKVPDRRLEELYRGADVLAVPSEHEGFGIVYLEAMSFGLVPLASRSGGAVEIVGHGKCGFLIEPGDAAALARVIAELISDPALLLSLKAEALRKAAGFPGWTESLHKARDFLIRQSAGLPSPPPSLPKR